MALILDLRVVIDFMAVNSLHLLFYLSQNRASELQNRIANQCVQLHGGWGYMLEFPIAKAYVDSRVQPIYGGSNEIMKELIARQIVAD